MITYINYGIFIWFYILVPILFFFSIYKLIFKNKYKKTVIFVLFICIASLLWLGYELYPNTQKINTTINVTSVEALSKQDIVEHLLVAQFNDYKKQKLLDKDSLIDYKINHIKGPQNGNYYSISYSIKTISPYWLAGNGTEKGLWIYNKSDYYQLLEHDGIYELKFVGGL